MTAGVGEPASLPRLPVSSPVSPDCCPHCGAAPVHRHGSRVAHYRDLPDVNGTVTFAWERRRFICTSPGCMKTCSETHPDLHSTRMMTRRLYERIGEAVLDRTFADVSRELAIDETTIRNVFREWCAEKLPPLDRIAAPRALGMDVIGLMGKERAVLLDIDARSLVDLLPDTGRGAMAARLSRMPGLRDVEIVVLPLSTPWLELARRAAPQADHVVDWNRICNLADDALELLRKSIRTGLGAKPRRRLLNDRTLLAGRRRDLDADARALVDSWADELPTFGAAYAASEALRDIGDSACEREARERYEAWRGSLSAETSDAFRAMLYTVSTLETPVFNRFSHGARLRAPLDETGAWLSAISSGSILGHSFDAVRARLMISGSANLETT